MSDNLSDGQENVKNARNVLQPSEESVWSRIDVRILAEQMKNENALSSVLRAHSDSNGYARAIQADNAQ